VLLKTVGVQRVRVGAGCGRVAAQQRVLEVVVAGVEPEAGHAELEPEAHLVQHLLLDRRVVKVQVGWLSRKVWK
jgi:hypothetical protein